MNDELHNKLMNAGFYGDSVVETDGKIEHTVCPFADCCGASLSELIEACDKLVEDVFFLSGHEENWTAVDGRDGFGIFAGIGKTPAEATVNLWLELNKK